MNWKSFNKNWQTQRLKFVELGEEISLLSQLHDQSSANQFPPETELNELQGEIASLREELIISQEIIASLPSENELLAMQMEIETLREELSSKDSPDNENEAASESKEKEILQEQLETAIAESFDLQMELERTLDKLAELESLVDAKSGKKFIDSFSRRFSRSN